jgi:hypothetical protein
MIIAETLPQATRWRLNLYKKPTFFDARDQERVRGFAAAEKDIPIWKDILKREYPLLRYED